MELSDEILESIRAEMLPLAEKWWEYDIWKQNRIITAQIYEYNVSIPEKLHKKVLLPIFQVWCQAIAYLDLWGAYPLPFEQKIYLFIGPNIYFYKL